MEEMEWKIVYLHYNLKNKINENLQKIRKKQETKNISKLQGSVSGFQNYIIGFKCLSLENHKAY